MFSTRQSHDASWTSPSATFATLLTLLFLILVFLFIVIAAQPAHSQTYRVIYNFTEGVDGAEPGAGLSMDGVGNLYGTTMGGGSCNYGGCGTIFKLTKTPSGWGFSSLYAFGADDDGSWPESTLDIGTDGSLYGTTMFGGGGNCSAHPLDGRSGCGTVFKLSPNILGGWTETVLYRFKGQPDGWYPYNSPVTFDAQGSLYLTTGWGGQYNDGIVVKLSPAVGEWTESILYNFAGSGDGAAPPSGVIFDESGRLYGVTYFGSTGGGHCYFCGTVFQLSPSYPEWTKKTIYSFHAGPDGEQPWGGLIIDSPGNLYGTSQGIPYTPVTALGSGGSVFKLMPSGDDWTIKVLHSFVARQGYSNPGPSASLVMDAAGNLYGTTFENGSYNYGAIFKLTPSASGWIYTSLHDFRVGEDGWLPLGSVLIAANGNLYGTTSAGGIYGGGVVWEITP